MRISIVTPTVDDAPFLDEAISSVPYWKQGEVEHIVVHDGSAAFALALQTRHRHLKLVKGPGRGATAAVADGIALATGDFVLQLNSDDRLFPTAFDSLFAAATRWPEVGIWTGGTRIFTIDGSGREIIIRHIQSPEATKFSLLRLFDDIPLIPARFIHRSVFSKIGSLDQRFLESSDREFMIRAFINGVTEGPLDVLVSAIRLHLQSRTTHRRPRWVPPYLAEHLRIADMWLVSSTLAPEKKRSFRSWRAREVLRLAVYQLLAHQWAAAARTVSQESTVDPLWWCRAPSIFGALSRRRQS